MSFTRKQFLDILRVEASVFTGEEKLFLRYFTDPFDAWALQFDFVV